MSSLKCPVFLRPAPRLSAISKLSAVGVAVLAVIGVGGGAAASAAPVPAAHGTAIKAASCNWNPANNANVAGQVKSGEFPEVYSAPACGDKGFALFPGDPVTVRCGSFDSSDGLWWDYVTGLPPTPSFSGWVADETLTYPPAHQPC